MSDSKGSRVAVLALVVLVAAGAGFLLGRVREARSASDSGEHAVPAEAGSATAALSVPASDSESRSSTGEAPVAFGGAEGAAPRQPGESVRRTVGPAPEPEAKEEESAAGPPAAAPSAAPEPEPVEVEVVVPAGTKIRLRLLDGVSSQTSVAGQTVEAEVTSALAAGGVTAIPAGARVHGRVSEAHALRKVGGQARLAIAFESVEVDGARVPIQAFFAHEGRSETGKDAATIAAGAVVGTVLGNQARKNDRGKVVGGLLGAGVGTAVAAATKGETVELGPGAELELTLRADVPVRVRG